MSDSDNTSSSSGEQSVTRSSGSFSVSASPFNGVKMELGVLVILGILLSLVAGRLFGQRQDQILFLSGYGVLAMLWLIYRVRQVLAKIQSEQAEGQGEDGQK